MIELARSLKFIPYLTKLDISSNIISQKGMVGLCQCLKGNSYLTYIDISTKAFTCRNKIGESGGLAFAELMGRQENVL